MFVQVIRGKVTSAVAMRAASQDWTKNLKPGASGYLGATEGVADDGVGVTVARFDSEESARTNNDRPEQGEWWKNVGSKVFENEPEFMDFTDVELFLGGGSDDAGFVQVMFGKVKDVAKDKELGAKFESQMREVRPDVLGGFACYAPDGTFVNVTYFTSEADAREGEKKDMGLDEMMQNIEGQIEFVDLRDPWFDTA
jgi:hypothetical protein